MHIDSIMAEYEAACEWRGDAGQFPRIVSVGVYRSIVARVVERKKSLVKMLGLDETGRRFFEGSPIPMREVADAARGGDLLMRAWNALEYDVRSHMDNADAKTAGAWAPWLSSMSWSRHTCLVEAVTGAETVLVDTGKRRVRMGKLLSAFGEAATTPQYRPFLDGIWRSPNASTLDLLSIVMDCLRNGQSPSFLLTVNPVDLFLMSSDCSYDSCHKPNGLYPGAAWQYMADRFTGMLLHLPRDRGDFPWRKLGRALVHADPAAFYLGRPYGSFNGNDALGRNASERMGALIDEHWFSEPGQWSGATSIGVYGHLENRLSAYGDCNFLAAYARGSSFDPDSQREAFLNDMPIFTCERPFCCCCGDEYERSDTYERKRECMDCTGDRFDATCDHCGSDCRSADTITVGGGDDVCEDCYSNHYRRCPSCDDLWPSDDFRNVRTGRHRWEMQSWCEGCTDDLDRCTGCGCSVREDDATTVNAVSSYFHTRNDGTRVRRPRVGDAVFCEHCVGNIEVVECGECDEPYMTTTSSFPALIELRTMDGLRPMCRGCARNTYDAIHEDGAHWTREALGEHRLDEMLAMIFANESPAIRSCLEEVGL